LLPAAAQQKDTVLVHFEFNRSEITTVAAAILDSLVSATQPAGLQQIKLFGHCDFIGSDSYNDSLSQSRILSVKEYLLQKGLPENIFSSAMAYGERKPAVPGTTDAARTLNRRVELIISVEPVVQSNLSERIKDSAVQSSLILENLNFEGGRHFLLPESMPILDELLKALQNNPTVTIEIQGYVCCTEATTDGLDLDLQTQDLSVQRAKAIYNFLIEKGIDAKRLRYQGFGGTRKIYPNEMDEFERSRNRRVEIKILSK
jgi:outer membrane protein OmpA-like peptidoglycan-associated protein